MTASVGNENETKQRCEDECEDRRERVWRRGEFEVRMMWVLGGPSHRHLYPIYPTVPPHRVPPVTHYRPSEMTRRQSEHAAAEPIAILHHAAHG